MKKDPWLQDLMIAADQGRKDALTELGARAVLAVPSLFRQGPSRFLHELGIALLKSYEGAEVK